MRLLPPPGPQRRGQLAALVVAVGVLAVVVRWQWPSAAPPAATSAAASKDQAAPPVSAATRGAANTSPLPAPVRLSELETVPDRVEVGRNPFAFGTRPAPAPAPVPVAPPQTVSGAPPQPISPAGPPPIRLVLTGMLVLPQDGRTMVTLRDPETGASFRAFEGDVLDGRYRIVSVGPRSVTVSYVDGAGQRTIPLGGG